MPTNPEQDTYYYVGDNRIPLFTDPQVFAVHLQQAAQLEPETLSAEARQLLAEAQPITFLLRDGLNVYRAESGLKIVEVLRQEAGVALALPGFRRSPQGRDTVFVTPRLLAQFRPELGPEKIGSVLERLGLLILEPLPYAAPNGFLLEAAPGPDGLGALVAANTLVEEGLVIFAEPDLIQSRYWRNGPPPDPTAAAYLGQQWHLQATGVLDAWQETQGSPSIWVAVLDDGLDLDHAEFSAAVSSGQPKVVAQFDFAIGTEDASPKTYVDNHGTACAGVVAAAGVKAAGAAPNCRLIVARTPDYMGVSDEALMFQWAADSGADVISCSWGPKDGTGEIVPLPTPTRLAIRYCLNYGRAGKGIAIFWAAGNGSELVSKDGYASNPDVMAIAACTAAEAPAVYSDFGPEIFACAPSNGGYGQPAIFTSDRAGLMGYNPGNTLRGDVQGNYTKSFGGTSAAAPLAAGITALALSANPNLTVAQVRDLLRETADRIGNSSTYDSNGHSDRLGYGRLNAAKVVAAARQTTPASTSGPTILGPSSWSRVDGPPVFQVDPSPHACYVIEVTINKYLLDSVTHGSERTEDNFYGSWSDSPFLVAPSYTLPMAAWTRLRWADRLSYRVGASANLSGYVDYIVSTPDDQWNMAPSIEIVSGIGAPPRAPGIGRRTVSELARSTLRGSGPAEIEGPLHWDRELGPPTFRIELEPGAVYTVEVAADSKRFDAVAFPSEQPQEDYFRSDRIKYGYKIGAPQLGFQAYTLPLPAWEALQGSSRLYYRLMIHSGDSVTGPCLVMNLTGEATVLREEGEGEMRTDEALWRMPG